MNRDNRRKWIHSGLYSLGSRISILILGFGSFYFLIRYLPKDQFGIWSLFLMVTAIVEMSRNGLVQNALIKLLHSSAAEDALKVITASWIINIFFSLCIYSIIFFCSEFVAEKLKMPELEVMFKLYGVTILLLIPLSQFNYLEQSKSSFSGIFWSSFFRQATFFFIVISIYIFNFQVSVVDLVWFQSIGAFVGLIIAYLFTKDAFKMVFIFDWVITKRVLSFGKYVMGTNITSLFFKSVDQFSIGFFLDASSVALYNSAMRLSNLIEYPATSVAEVVYPHSTVKIRDEGEVVVKSIYEKSLGLTLAITTPIVLFVFIFSDWLIYLIAGPEYADSARILRVVILFGMVIPFNRQYGMTMDSTGRPHLNFFLLVLALGINILSNFLFIYFYGLIGAAYGTLLSYILIGAIGHIILHRLFKIRIFNVFQNMWKFYIEGFTFARDYIRKFVR